MDNKFDLSFEDFNYEKAKALLPDEFEPIPYLPIEIPAPEKLVKIHGFSPESEAIKRMQEFSHLYPSNDYQIIPNRIRYEKFRTFIK